METPIIAYNMRQEIPCLVKGKVLLTMSEYETNFQCS